MVFLNELYIPVPKMPEPNASEVCMMILRLYIPSVLNL